MSPAFGDPETVIGGEYRDKATGQVSFVVESEQPVGHVSGTLTRGGRSEFGAFRWAVFHDQFELARDEGSEGQ